MSKDENKYKWFGCKFGLINSLLDLNLKRNQTKVFSCIIEKFSAENYYNKNNRAVEMSVSELMEKTKCTSKGTIERAIEFLIQGKLIERVKRGTGTKPSTYKVIDKRFVPLKSK